MLCYVMLCYVMLCYVMLCYVMLCYVMLCYVMLCYLSSLTLTALDNINTCILLTVLHIFLILYTETSIRNKGYQQQKKRQTKDGSHYIREIGTRCTHKASVHARVHEVSLNGTFINQAQKKVKTALCVCCKKSVKVIFIKFTCR